MSLTIILALAALFNLAAGQAAPPAAAGDGPPLTVNTPTSVQACLPVAISWTGGAPPVYVSLIKGGDPSSPILKDFGPQTDSSLTWQVDQPAGSSLTVQIRDSKGKLNYSDKFTVQPSTQTCKTGSASATGGSAAQPGSAPTPAGNTPKPAAPGSTPPGSSPTGSTTPSASTPPAASGNTASTAPGSPGAEAPKSDASRAIPGFLVLATAGALALFA